MNIQSVTFYNQEIQVLNYEGKPYIAMKSIVENIGLAWNAQIERINRNAVLSSTTRMIRSVAEDGKNRELLCLPLGMLNGWLFGIEINRCKPEIREVLRLYQLECFDVLYKHFMPIHEESYPIVPVCKSGGKVLPDSRRWHVAVTVTDNLFKGSVKFEGVAHDTKAIVTNLAEYFGFKINSLEKFGDALERTQLSQ